MSELVDLVNDRGKVVERYVSRDAVNQYPGLHMQVAVVVIFNPIGQLLIHERVKTNPENPGHIDHVCGAVQSGEVPAAAARRETLEEVGIELQDLHFINSALNSYSRYRHLFVGESSEQARQGINGRQVAWSDYRDIDNLMTQRTSGELTVAGEFFEDLALAHQAR